MAADFDLVAGGDLHTAVARAARWRRCSHVVVPRGRPGVWWRWLRGETIERLAGLAAEVAILALPAAGPVGEAGRAPACAGRVEEWGKMGRRPGPRTESF